MTCCWCRQPILPDYPMKEEQQPYGTIYFHDAFLQDCWDFYQQAKKKLEAIRTGKEAL